MCAVFPAVIKLMYDNNSANHASHSLRLLSDAIVRSCAQLHLLMSGTKAWCWVFHLQVRGYDHVGPYDPEIGAPRPVLKRTNSNASSESRCTHAHDPVNSHPVLARGCQDVVYLQLACCTRSAA